MPNLRTHEIYVFFPNGEITSYQVGRSHVVSVNAQEPTEDAVTVVLDTGEQIVFKGLPFQLCLKPVQPN